MNAMICTVGLNPTPVALAVLTSDPRPDEVLLVCSTASQDVANQLIEVLQPLVPNTGFRCVPIGSGVSWRATYAALAGRVPAAPYRLDYTGGTTSMAMAAVKIHLEQHHSSVDGGSMLRSYIDEHSGQQVHDSGTATAVNSDALTIDVLARLHGAELTIATTLDTTVLPTAADPRLDSFIAATRAAVAAQAITDNWASAWTSIGLGEVFSRLRPPRSAPADEQNGRFVELVSLAASIACGRCEEIAFDAEVPAIVQYDVIARSGHRLVCIESKKGINAARDELGHRMSLALTTFGGAARVQIHLLAAPERQDFLTAYADEVQSWRHALPELDRVHLIHTFTRSRTAAHNPDPFGAMIEQMWRDLPTPSPAIGRTAGLQRSKPAAGETIAGTVMIAAGGSTMLTSLILDNEQRTVILAGPRSATDLVPPDSDAECVETASLSARAVWQATEAACPEAVLPTSSKKSAAAGLLRYAHESGAAVEHLLPRGIRELGNGETIPLTVPPRWHDLLTTEGPDRRARRLPGLYQPYSDTDEVWIEQHSLIDFGVLKDLASRWSRVDGVEVFVSADSAIRAAAPVILTHGFFAFALGSPFGGRTINWSLARSLTAAQATVLDTRFGLAIRTWVALSDRAQQRWNDKHQANWAALWDRLHLLSGIDETRLPPPFTGGDLDAAIAGFLGSEKPERI